MSERLSNEDFQRSYFFSVVPYSKIGGRFKKLKEKIEDIKEYYLKPNHTFFRAVKGRKKDGNSLVAVCSLSNEAIFSCNKWRCILAYIYCSILKSIP